MNKINETDEKEIRRTHPWLSFQIDLSRASPHLWLILGECQSKCEHMARVPLRPVTSKQLHNLYLAKGALATTAIEGNTLTEEEVLKHLEGKLKLPPSRQYLAQEIDNVVLGCNSILGEVQKGLTPQLTPERIIELNRIVLNNLVLDEGVVPGEIRRREVGVARYRGAPARHCEYLLSRLCLWLNGPTFEPSPGMSVVYAIVKAVLAHLYLAWIHPFEDGNGRTARLIEFQILIASGVPAPAAHLLSNHYNQTRTEYYRQLDQASRSGGEVLPFMTYAVQGFLDGLKSQLAVIWEQQWDIAWRNYVYELFRDKQSKADHRRRRLILDLSNQSESVPLGRLTEISPRVAAEYANKTKKTLSRDLNALLKMGILEKDANGYRARRDIILGFLPPRAS